MKKINLETKSYKRTKKKNPIFCDLVPDMVYIVVIVDVNCLFLSSIFLLKGKKKKEIEWR